MTQQIAQRRSDQELDGLRGSQKTWEEIYHYRPPHTTLSRNQDMIIETIFLVGAIAIAIFFLYCCYHKSSPEFKSHVVAKLQQGKEYVLQQLEKWGFY
jgi:hypothetical protein